MSEATVGETRWRAMSAVRVSVAFAVARMAFALRYASSRYETTTAATAIGRKISAALLIVRPPTLF